MSQRRRADQPSFNRQRVFEELGLQTFLEQRQCVDLGPLPIHCEIYPGKPNSPVILFIPGIGTYSEIYTEFLARFSAQGYTLVSVDIRGHGYSGGERGDYRIDDVVADLKQVIDYCASEYSGPLALFGCSIGARLALALAEQEPRVKALICHTLFVQEDPPDIWHHIGWQWLSLNAFWFPQLKVDFRRFIDINALLEHNPMGRFAEQDPLLVWEYPLRTLDSAYSCPSSLFKHPLGIPALMLVGERDEVLRPSYLKRLIARSAQPFDYIEIEGAGHMLPFDHIQETLLAVDNWLSEHLTHG